MPTRLSGLHPPTLSPADRRALLIGGAGVAVILVAGRAVPAWHAWVTDARAGAAELRTEQARAAITVRAFPALRDSARARRARAGLALSSLLRAGSAAAAGAALAERTTDAAAAAHVRLGALSIDALDQRGCAAPLALVGPRARPAQTTPATVTTPPCIRRVRVRTELTGDLRGVSEFLASLERGPVRITVPQLALVQAAPNGQPTLPEVLRGTVTLEALAMDSTPPLPGYPLP